jgi:hypothetical protein
MEYHYLGRTYSIKYSSRLCSSGILVPTYQATYDEPVDQNISLLYALCIIVMAHTLGPEDQASLLPS